ncbi:hypothetical protein F504_4174 (plasmid) [Ralstonia pseudosolanacearum FQY_4]|nr:hypothetical protein F504_4174 [Ralstonia pseudosolanacearum FQY_4]
MEQVACKADETCFNEWAGFRTRYRRAGLLKRHADHFGFPDGHGKGYLAISPSISS